MSEYKSNLRPIAMDYLYEGMEVDNDIFSYNGGQLLIGKGTILSKNKIQSLKNFNANRNIFVHASTYEMLIEHSAVPKSYRQQQIEKELGYTEAKKKTNELLKDARDNNSVSKEQAYIISRELSDKIETVDQAMIFQCIHTPNPIDEYLYRHSVNVSLLNGLMGKWLKLSKEDIDLLVMAGLVHDVGKTKIPQAILDAPRKLTRSEFEVIKMHPIYSFELLGANQAFVDPVKYAARHHHEKINGDGYPDMLSMDRISLMAKVTAISDIYDAMVAKRSYKDAKSPFLILSQLANMQFSDLDIGLVRIFTQHMPSELVNKPVLLSDGSVAITRYVLPNNLEYPIVEVNGTVFQTNPNKKCVRLIYEDEFRSGQIINE